MAALNPCAVFILWSKPITVLIKALTHYSEWRPSTALLLRTCPEITKAIRKQKSNNMLVNKEYNLLHAKNIHMRDLSVDVVKSGDEIFVFAS
jgi:hypothetical protein